MRARTGSGSCLPLEKGVMMGKYREDCQGILMIRDSLK
jgi:hypothetical protein